MHPPISTRQRQAVRAFLERVGDCGCLITDQELADRLGLKTRSAAWTLRHGLAKRGLVTLGPCPTFHAALFKGFRFDPETGLQRVF